MKQTQTIIQPGRMNDLPDIVGLYNKLIDALVEGGINYPCWKKHIYPNEKTALAGIAAQTIFIAKDGDSLAGTVILDNCQPDAYSKLSWSVSAEHSEILVIHTLAVHPDYFKSGIASKLIEFAVEYACNQRCKAIRLDVTANNSSAIRLYEKFGFIFIGEADLGLSIPGLTLFKCYEKIV